VVEVNEGAESVLLPCVYSDKLPGDPFLIWTRSDLSPNSVHLRRENGDDFKNQNQRFRNRTSMNPDALNTGNFSLTLRKPQQSDGGNYTCSISDGREELNLKQIHLKRPGRPETHCGSEICKERSEHQVRAADEGQRSE
uniref:Ig-like domain-containing protein n=1 Tax=Xiphophorus maculatus TaxID=8083 RepID=A0A3B5QSM8_XIPMA